MKRNAKRVMSLLLSVVMIAASFSVLTTSIFAQTEDLNLKKGTFKFAPHTVLDEDLEDYYYYTDRMFDGSAFDYNEHLATMSMILCAASISSQDVDADYEVKSRNIEALMIDLDFWGFEVNIEYTLEPEEQTMGVAMAYRVIGEGEDAYTVLAIIPRSAGYKREWAGNFTVGKEGVHEGFATGRDIILGFAKEYVEYYADEFVGDVKIWTMGYSRGAGVTNLVAASLVDNAKENLGLEVKQENIFAYTFGTPSTVQYADAAQKEAFATNYANIWNVHSDYDIVTFAPFRNWNFTYYGKTREMDVYNAEKKATMLTFLEKTNKVVYDLYTAENSAADPDNFAAVMIELVGGSISYAPADESYGIPTNQKDFLNSRITYLVENLVPDRETYVNEGYEYMLQRVMSLYFGLDDTSALVGAMTQNGIPLAASYYCYYVAEHVLNEENVVPMAAVLSGSIAYLEQYIAGLAEQNEQIVETEWYLMINELLNNETYLTVKQLLATASPEQLKGSLVMIRETLESMAITLTADALESGVSALELDEDTMEELLETMTDEKVTKPLMKFLVCLLLGHEDVDALTAFDPTNKSLAIAATFLYNSGRYMRVHNNEILLSWLRAEDSYYLNPQHVHEFLPYSEENEHGYVCECGEKSAAEAHSFEEWVVIEEATKDQVGMKKRQCACGYIQYEEIPALAKPTNVLWIVIAASAGALVVAGGVTAVIVVKKRRKAK